MENRKRQRRVENITNTREDTGYTKPEPAKKRVPIHLYGKKARLEKVKAETLASLKDSLKTRNS